MTRKLVFCILICISSVGCCSKKADHEEEKSGLVQANRVVVDGIQNILDSANVSGSVLIYDAHGNVYYSNDFQRADSGFIPASTFKIPHSLIALEIGIVENDSTLIVWIGEKSSIENWNQDLTFKEAFLYSCVPCYRQIARKVGVERMNKYLSKFKYGHMVVDSTTLDIFWLKGPSKISQMEQIAFLRKYYDSELPISKKTEEIAKKMMKVEENNSYSMLAKTGRSITDIGWYVGYIESENKVYFFATNIVPRGPFKTETRKEVTLKVFELLEIIQ